MALDTQTIQELHRLLTASENGDPRNGRLVEDAQRLWRRVQRLTAMNLIAPDADARAMELACYAMHLPSRHPRGRAAGRPQKIGLKERCEQAAELLLSALADQVPERVLEHAAQILREIPLRSAGRPESRLLADAVNLDDFGVTGFLAAAMNLARQNEGVAQVADGFRKRREYGYWEARLKDGFHFEPIRQIARHRLDTAQQLVDLLLAELQEDQQP